MINWLLKLTKVGKLAYYVQEYLDGKKTYIVGAATAIPALANILLSVSKDGLPAILNAVHTSDWTQLMLGIGMITGRAAIAKAS